MGGGMMPGGGIWRILIWVILLGLLGPWLWNALGLGGSLESEVQYSVFRTQVQEGNVQEVTVSGDQITGVFDSPVEKTLPGGDTTQITEFVTYLPSFGDDQLLSLLEEQGVAVNTQPESNFPWLTVLTTVLPLLLLLGLGYMLLSSRRR